MEVDIAGGKANSGQSAFGPFPELRTNSSRRQLSGFLHRLVSDDYWGWIPESLLLISQDAIAGIESPSDVHADRHVQNNAKPLLF